MHRVRASDTLPEPEPIVAGAASRSVAWPSLGTAVLPQSEPLRSTQSSPASVRTSENVADEASTGGHAARCRHCRGLLSAEDEEAHLRATEERLSNCHWYYPRLTRQEAKTLLQRMDVGAFLLRDSSDARYMYALSLKTPRGVMSIRITYDRGQFVFDCAERRAADSLMRFECALDLVQFYYACHGGGAPVAANVTEAPSEPGQPRDRHRLRQQTISPSSSPSPSPSLHHSSPSHHHSPPQQHHNRNHRHHYHDHREHHREQQPPHSSHQQLQQQQQKKWTFFVDKSGKNMPMVLSRPALRSLPSLAHLCRLRINCQLAEATGGSADPAAVVAASSRGVQLLPLPPALKAYLASYPNCV